jgi:LysM repeat protein
VGKLQKAQIQRLKPNGKPDSRYPALEVQYNPTEYTLDKSVQVAEVAIPGLDSPLLQFVRGQNETLSLELFFDTTDDGMGENATSVTSETNDFYKLVKIDNDLHAPPVCLFTWGGQEFPGGRTYGASGQGAGSSQKRYGFKCIVESVQQKYTLFSPQGVPLRATLTVKLREYKTLTDQLQELNLMSADHTRAHVVQRGETLSGIAAEVYGDPGEWRAIAEHNGVVDPMAIQPGSTLTIPPLD